MSEVEQSEAVTEMAPEAAPAAPLHALVLGLGESGLAMARWLQYRGYVVRVADTRAAPARLLQWQALNPERAAECFVAGEFGADLLQGVDVLAVSPGLAPRGELAQILPAAQAAGITPWGEIEIFAQALQALQQERGYAPKIIAITGTNGKTTVTSMVGQLAQRAGLRAQVAGNISPAALDVLYECLQNDSLPQVWALELSSFQLHFTYSLNPHAATVLNLTQDHLDWHADMAEYGRDKARIFGPDTVRILNREDALVMAMHGPDPAKVQTFGVDTPRHCWDMGLVAERGMQWLAQAEPCEEEDGPPKRRKKGEVAPAVPTMLKHLMPVDALQVRGQHNAANALAALALCRACGMQLAPLLHGLREYQGQPHRVELVRLVAGHAWYDDSKGTNVGATVAALKGLGGEMQADGGSARLVLLAGGVGKDQDFSPLAAPVARYARSVILFGRDAPQIAAALEGCGVPLLRADDLAQAVQMADQACQQGDAVLFSPACASFDMFDNYVHRAQVFIGLVQELALDKGEV